MHTKINNEETPYKVIGGIIVLIICIFIVGLAIVKIPAKSLRKNMNITNTQSEIETTIAGEN